MKKFRIALTKLRVSSHRLNVETGRWHRPIPIPYENRICDNCGCMENEYHFVMECSMYEELRRAHLKRTFYVLPSMQRFIDLISSRNKSIIQNLATFIVKANDLRNKTLYNR